MFIYQKDGTLDIMFQKSQFPAVSENDVDILLKKVDGEVKILIDGKTLDTNGPLTVSPTTASITGGGSTVELTVTKATGKIKCNKKASGSTATGLTNSINQSTGKITVTASADATAGTWIYTVSDDNDSVDVTFTVSAA